MSKQWAMPPSYQNDAHSAMIAATRGSCMAITLTMTMPAVVFALGLVAFYIVENY